MQNFKIIRDVSEINLDSKWVPAKKFKGKDKLVDAQGNEISATYTGRQYKIVEKRVWAYSCPKLYFRKYLGILAVIYSLGLALFSKSVRNLFKKSGNSFHFAIEVPPFKEAVKKVGDGLIVDPKGKEKTPTPTPIGKTNPIQIVDTPTKLDKDGQTVFIEPELLYYGAKISEDEEINIAIVRIQGKDQLVPVVGPKIGLEYKNYNGPISEALLKIAQNKERFTCMFAGRIIGSPIKHFLNHILNDFITEEEFFQFINQKDSTGTPRLCTLNYASLLEVLKMAREKNIPLDLKEKTSEGKTLFTLWAGNDDLPIIEEILTLEPSMIEQIHDGESLLVKSALNGFRDETDYLLKAMEKHGIALTPEELWVKRILNNDCSFIDQEFTDLDSELKIKIFYIANAFLKMQMVKRMKNLGMDEKPIFKPCAPQIVAANMDIFEAQKALETFLQTLRDESMLFTEDEFCEMKRSDYQGRSFGQFQSLVGKLYLEEIIKANDLKHIKIVQKLVVPQDVQWKGMYFPYDMNKDFFCDFYNKKVAVEERKIRLEEALEIMIFAELLQFTHFENSSFYISKDGIYFANTDFYKHSDRKLSLSNLKESLIKQLDPDDVEKFSKALEERARHADPEDAKRIDEEKKAYKDLFKKSPYKKLKKGYLKETFDVSLKDLIKIK